MNYQQTIKENSMKYLVTFLFLVMVGCAATTGIKTNEGSFVYSGPISADTEVLAIRWRYGFKFSRSVTDIENFSIVCSGIPAPMISISGFNIKMDDKGIGVWSTEPVAVTPESTPWLYTNSTTSDICKATISRAGVPDSYVTQSISFAGPVKKALLQQLTSTHEYNMKLKTSNK